MHDIYWGVWWSLQGTWCISFWLYILQFFGVSCCLELEGNGYFELSQRFCRQAVIFDIVLVFVNSLVSTIFFLNSTVLYLAVLTDFICSFIMQTVGCWWYYYWHIYIQPIAPRVILTRHMLYLSSFSSHFQNSIFHFEVKYSSFSL